MKIDNSLITHLISFNLQPAIHHFEQTQDQSKLEDQINFCIEQINICKDTETKESIRKIHSTLKIESELKKENLGILKAIKLLESKYKLKSDISHHFADI